MRLSEQLLQRCEEFFEEIPEDRSPEVDDAVESLTVFLEEHIDGWEQSDSGDLAFAVLRRLEEIWDLLTAESREHMDEFYEELMVWLEGMTRPDADIPDDDDLCFGDEEDDWHRPEDMDEEDECDDFDE